MVNHNCQNEMEIFQSLKSVKGLQFKLTSMSCQNSKIIFQSPELLLPTATMLSEYDVAPEISKRELMMANRLKINLWRHEKRKIANS